MTEILKLKKTILEKGYIKNFVFLESVTSTNTYTKENIHTDDSLIITFNQTAGRGRFERVWISEPFKNLTFTLVKFFEAGFKNYSLINFYATYIIASSLKSVLPAGNNVSVKWPNDILLNNKKIAGILLETVQSDKKDKSLKFIIGIGMNLNQTCFPENFIYPATSVYNETGKSIDISDFLPVIITNFYENIDLIEKPDILIRKWKSFCMIIGKEISFKKELNSKPVTGRVVDVDSDGSIIIDVKGEKMKYYTGEISFIF